MTPVRPSRPVAVAGCCPLRNRRIPCEDQTSKIGLAATRGVDQGHAGGCRIHRSLKPRVGELGDRDRRRFRMRNGRIVDLGIVAPFHVLRDYPAFLQILDAFKIGEVAIRLPGVSGQPVQIVKLEARGREQRIQLGSFFELSLRVAAPVHLVVESAQLIMRDRLRQAFAPACLRTAPMARCASP